MAEIEPAQRYRVLDLVIDVPTGTVDRAGERIALPPKTFELLLALVHRAPGVVRRHDLLEAVWPDEHVTEQTLSRRVFVLRHALGDDAAHPRYVAGERGWGYRLVPPVDALPRPAPRRRPRPLLAGVTLGALATAAAIAALRPSCGIGAATAPLAVVRVAPFDSSPRDKDVEWLAAHLARAARDRVGRLPGVRAVATETRAPADLVLLGRVERAPSGVAAELRLEGRASGGAVWTRSFTGSARELLLAEAALATSAADAVGRALAVAPPAMEDAGAAEAGRLCLRGLYFWAAWTPDSLRHALEAFERAGGLAPGFADTEAGRALVLATQALLGEPSPSRLLLDARETAGHALARAPGRPLSLASAALVRLLADDDSAGAERAARAAVLAEPDDLASLVVLSLVLGADGRHAESVPLLQRAGRADPFAACVPLLLGRALLHGGRASEAAAAFERAAALPGSPASAHHGLAQALASLGEDARSFEAERLAWRIDGVPPAEQAALERAFAAGGLAALRRRACRSGWLERRTPDDAVRACAAAGETARALALLGQAREERRPGLRLLVQEPALEGIREAAREVLARPAPVAPTASPTAPPPSARHPG